MSSGGGDDVRDDDFDALLAELAEAPPVLGAADADLLVGREIGRFRVVERVGRGGMGVVYRAHDATLDRDVALKLLPFDASADPDKRARFQREARASAKLSHPNIAAIYDVGFDEDAGVAYIAMELVRGVDLRKVLVRAAPAMSDVEKWAMQIARASAAAHDAGIVHRDLKPENVMISPEGDAKILDFGLAARVDDLSSDESAHVIAGTPGYMAPEQAEGKSVDARADVYAIGVVVKEMLAGRDAGALDDVIATCLSTDASKRYASARALVGALSTRVSAVNTPMPRASVSMANVVPLRRSRAATVLAIAAASAVVASVVVAVVVVGGHRVKEPPHLASIPIVSDDPVEQAAFRAAVIALYDDETTGARLAADILKKDPDASAAWLVAAMSADSVGETDFWSVIAKARAATTRRPAQKSIVDLLDFLEAYRTTRTSKQMMRLDDDVAAFIDAHPGDYFIGLLARLSQGSVSREALATGGKLWAMDHGPIGPAMDYADGLLTAGKRDEARAVVDEVLRTHPGNDMALNERALILYSERKLDAAKQLLEELERRKPDVVNTRTSLLTVARESGDRETEEREIAALSSGAMLPLYAASSLSNHAVMLLADGRVKDALHVHAIAISLMQKLGIPRLMPASLAKFGSVLSATQDWDAVSSTADELAHDAAAPGVPQVMVPMFELTVTRARCERAAFLGKLDDADRELAALDASPDSAFTSDRDRTLAYDRALVLAAHGKPVDALAALEGKALDGAIGVYNEPARRLQVADLGGDGKAALRAAADLAALAERCRAEDGAWERTCRIYVAWAYAIGADRAHAAGDDDGARAQLAKLDAWWPRADVDTPAERRAARVRAALAK